MLNWSDLMKNKLFITDAGDSMSTVVDGRQISVGRYAVWPPVRNSTGHQAIEVSNDLNQLMENTMCQMTGYAGLRQTKNLENRRM